MNQNTESVNTTAPAQVYIFKRKWKEKNKL